MQRRSILLYLLLASTPVGTSPVWAQQPAWQTITGADGRFSFDIATPFQETHSTGAYDSVSRGYQFGGRIPGGDGAKFALDITITDLGPGDPDYAAADPEAVLKRVLTVLQKRYSGSTVRAPEVLSLGPARGRSFTFTIEGGRVVLIGRAYFFNGRVYTQVGAVPPEHQNDLLVARFLNSLRIIR
jgi:hypothetical protein